METLKLFTLLQFAFQVRQHIFRQNLPSRLQVCLILLKKLSMFHCWRLQQSVRQVTQQMFIGSNLTVPAQSYFPWRKKLLVYFQWGTGCGTLLLLRSATHRYMFPKTLHDPRSGTIKCNQLSRPPLFLDRQLSRKRHHKSSLQVVCWLDSSTL